MDTGRPYGSRGGATGDARFRDTRGRSGERKAYGQRDDRAPSTRPGGERPRSGGGSGSDKGAWERGARSGSAPVRNSGRRPDAPGGPGSRRTAAGSGSGGSSRYNSRDGGQRDRNPRAGDSRPPRTGTSGERRPNAPRHEQDAARKGPRPPFLPRDLDLKLLPRGVRAELRGLSPERAETVGGHLLMAGQLIDEDPQLALRHAQAAKQGAPRLPIVREAVGEAAYAAGEYGEALGEFRALRRMTGTDEYVPAMADCERALGRYPAALKLVREGLASNPEAPAQIELRLVEAGIRADSGQLDEAVRLLQQEIENIGTRGTKVSRARLRYAYADLLERSGDTGGAERWFVAAAGLDPQGTTDAEDRLASLRGVVIEYDDSDDADDSEDASEDE